MVSRIFRKWEAAAIVRRLGASGLELLDRVALEAEAAPLKGFPPPAQPGPARAGLSRGRSYGATPSS
jgi:hypothetical protein